jgi:hypothetical protein
MGNHCLITHTRAAPTNIGYPMAKQGAPFKRLSSAWFQENQVGSALDGEEP